MPWSGTASAGSGTRFAVGKPSVRPRLSPWATIPRIPNGAPSSRAASATAPVAISPRMWVEETISPSSSTISHDPRLERVLRAQQRRVAAARGCRSGSSRRPTPSVAPSRSISSWSMNSCAVCAIRSPSNGITISSSTPSAGDQVGLLLERGQQLGRGLRRDDGARVRLEGQHAVGAADHRAVADVHAVELAHREPALRAAARRGARSVFISRGSLRRASGSRRRVARRGRSGRPRRAAGQMPVGAAGDGRRRGPPARRARRRARPTGRNDSASSSGDEPLLVASATSKSPIARAPQLDAVGVAAGP